MSALDTQYQFLGARDSFSVQARFITENQNLSASQALGLSSNSRNNLRSWQAKATYFYDQTVGLTAGYFHIDGTSDPLLSRRRTSVKQQPELERLDLRARLYSVQSWRPVLLAVAQCEVRAAIRALQQV